MIGIDNQTVATMVIIAVAAMALAMMVVGGYFYMIFKDKNKDHRD